MTTTAPSTTPATETTRSADGTPIAFERSGTGPVLVVVDGALCHRAFGPSRPVAKALGDRFTVVAYDRRGRGASGTGEGGPEREIEDLAAVIEAVGGDAAVLAFSSGAGLAYRAAATGVPMRRLIGYEAPWVGLRKNRDGTPRDYLGELDALVAAGRDGAAVDYFMVKMVKGPAFLPILFRLMRPVWKQLRAVAPTLPNDARAMGATFTVPTEVLARVDVPTLVLVGGRSPKEMKDAQQRVADAVPGAEHQVVPGQTHQVKPEALRDRVIAFAGA